MANIQTIGTMVKRALVDKEGNPIVSKATGEPIVDRDGNPIEVLEIKLSQKVDLLVDGKKVNFSSYQITGDDGKKITLYNKNLRLTFVEDEVAALNRRVEEGKVDADMAKNITDRYQRDNVQYTVKVASES